MERRTQRLLLLVLFFGVVYLLYASANSHQKARRRTETGSGSSGNAGQELLDVRGLESANSTLGVSCAQLY